MQRCAHAADDQIRVELGDIPYCIVALELGGEIAMTKAYDLQIGEGVIYILYGVSDQAGCRADQINTRLGVFRIAQYPAGNRGHVEACSVEVTESGSVQKFA